MQDYTTKPKAYFANPREQIAPLLPVHAARVLEVGCGTGATLQWLKSTGRCKVAIGMELFDSAAAIASLHADQIIVGNAEHLITTTFEPESFDLVLCLDVLEHMVDPWAFVANIEKLLKPGGTLISSIPNIRHLSTLIPLVVGGRWRYTTSGILDRTHLRFFTRASALELVTTERMKVARWMRNIPPLPSKSGVANLFSFGLLKDFLTFQYLIASCKSDTLKAK